MRIFHGLDRFSEDFNFSLLSPNPSFNLEEFLPALKNQVNSFGLNFDVEQKEKNIKETYKLLF